MKIKESFVKLLICLSFFYGCNSSKNITGVYFSAKKNNKRTNHIVLKIEDDRYLLESSSLATGLTKGECRMLKKGLIILIPDKAVIKKVTLGDSLYDSQEFRPFSDTIILKIKARKLLIKKGFNDANFYFMKQ
jgi:hypothetical protein